MPLERFYQCSDGHVYPGNPILVSLTSVHFGSKRLMRCPVDHRWRMAVTVSSGDLNIETAGEARHSDA